MYDVKSKKILSTGAEIRLEFGFTPAKCEVENLSTLKMLVYQNKLDAGETIMVSETGAKTLETTDGLSPTDNGSMGVKSLGGRGLVLGTKAGINNTVGQRLLVTAWRSSESEDN